jgi:ribosomal protein S18 acetylase RimI-like enzyme
VRALAFASGVAIRRRGCAIRIKSPLTAERTSAGDGSNSSDRFAMRPADPLDNPIWSALTGPQASMAFGAGLARRFAPDVSPLAGLAAPTAQAFADLAALAIPGARFAFFSPDLLDPPPEWSLAHAEALDQMLCRKQTPRRSREPCAMLRLGDSDASEMLALAGLTAPGPFLTQTHRMGRFLGVRTDRGVLAAMAGERLRLADYVEISAVCTAPEYRGRGYAEALMRALADRLHAEGRTPILHVLPANPARRLYEAIGFDLRRRLRLTIAVRS